MAALPALPAGARSRHRKRISVSRLSSDTTATLPEYHQSVTSLPWSNPAIIEPFEQPPDYPDSAEEADEETDDCLPLSPVLSPRRKRFFRSTSQGRVPKFPYHTAASQSDTFLDSLLERSVNALELSNTLLQSSMTTQTSLSGVLSADHATDGILDARARGLSQRINNNADVHERWMEDLDGLARDVEKLCDDGGPLSRSLPSSGPLVPGRNRRKTSLDSRKSRSEPGRLVSNAHKHQLGSHPPRALTQFVSVQTELGDTHESTSDASHIYLPSTIGLRSSSHLSHFGSSSLERSSSPEASANQRRYMRRQSLSPCPSQSSKTTRRTSRSPTPTYKQHSRSRSRSWSSGKLPSPQVLPRIIPPPIAELPSQSDSSNSESPQTFRTVEQLRSILDKQTPLPPVMATPSRSVDVIRSKSFSPRSPPITPLTSTTTTTTSISRLLTKGSHSTSTRPPSPPRQSSLKKQLSPLNISGPSTLSIPDLAYGSPKPGSSRTSSGRSTPRNVAFGPLPEPHREGNGGRTKFQEQKEEAKARARRRRSAKNGKLKGSLSEKEKEKDGESSWWTTWLTGGSLLSMAPARYEERAEDRMARWPGRNPGMGGGMFEDWPV